MNSLYTAHSNPIIRNDKIFEINPLTAKICIYPIKSSTPSGAHKVFVYATPDRPMGV